tara:strand:- start:16 stop:297 length:282 start_codon:yes stop_codon:yes gene_type:complete
MKETKAEREQNENPFMLAGFGINSYFDIMRSLGFMFLCMSLAMGRSFGTYIYNNQTALKFEPSYALNQLSLGNLGGSHVNCDMKKMSFEEVNM